MRIYSEVAEYSLCTPIYCEITYFLPFFCASITQCAHWTLCIGKDSLTSTHTVVSATQASSRSVSFVLIPFCILWSTLGFFPKTLCVISTISKYLKRAAQFSVKYTKVRVLKEKEKKKLMCETSKPLSSLLKLSRISRRIPGSRVPVCSVNYYITIKYQKQGTYLNDVCLSDWPFFFPSLSIYHSISPSSLSLFLIHLNLVFAFSFIHSRIYEYTSIISREAYRGIPGVIIMYPRNHRVISLFTLTGGIYGIFIYCIFNRAHIVYYTRNI